MNATDHGLPGGIDYNAAYFWLTLVIGLAQAALWIYVWNANRNRISEERIHKIELDYVTLKGRVDALPTQNQMMALGNQVAEVDGDMKAANEKLEGLDKRLELLGGTAQRIEQFLLDNTGGSKRHR